MRELLIEKYEKPTEIDDRGTAMWKNEYGELHRDGDKPAVIFTTGGAFWFKNGKAHRDNGKPAIICVDGEKFYFKNGIQYYPNINKKYERSKKNYYRFNKRRTQSGSQ